MDVTNVVKEAEDLYLFSTVDPQTARMRHISGGFSEAEMREELIRQGHSESDVLRLITNADKLWEERNELTSEAEK